MGEHSADEYGQPFAPMCSYRITQLYDTGACVYFYFGFIFRGLDDPVRKFAEIEALARDVVIECGGSISHHHGVGKLRKNWLAQSNSALGNSLIANVKQTVDPLINLSDLMIRMTVTEYNKIVLCSCRISCTWGEGFHRLSY